VEAEAEAAAEVEVVVVESNCQVFNLINYSLKSKQ
jgi:hypothetical protein